MQNKLFQIFKVGTHTPMSGNSLIFNENDLNYMAAVYQKNILRAPLVLGHPANNLPEYGFVNRLFVQGDRLYAEAKASDALVRMVQAKNYNNVSASFIAPNAPDNPTPGAYYLRHVGFLGAMPPAVKDLAPLAFAESNHRLSFAENFAITEFAYSSFVVPAGYQVSTLNQSIFNLAKDYQRVCPSMSFAEASQRAETIILNH
jgi:hypothetical protein